MRAGFVNVLDLNVIETSRKRCRDVVAAKARLTSRRLFKVDVSKHESKESRVRSVDQNLEKDGDAMFLFGEGLDRVMSRIGRWDVDNK